MIGWGGRGGSGNGEKPSKQKQCSVYHSVSVGNMLHFFVLFFYSFFSCNETKEPQPECFHILGEIRVPPSITSQEITKITPASGSFRHCSVFCSDVNAVFFVGRYLAFP